MRFVRLAAVAAALVFAASACGSSSSTGSSSTGTGQNGDPAIPSVAMPAAGGGSCKVDISGGAKVSFTGSQDMGTLQMDYWLNQAARSALGLADTDEGFLMNCQGGSQGSVSFTTTEGTTAATFAKGPGVYKIRAQLGTSTPIVPGQVQVLINLKDKQIWGTTAVGTFTVTKLDGGHFAGSFSVKIGTTGASPVSATLAGSFDLGCTSGACS